jgi:hypothetical protein
MIWYISVLVNKGSSCVVFSSFKATLTKDFSDSFAPGLISWKDTYPVDGVGSIMLVFFDKRS